MTALSFEEIIISPHGLTSRLYSGEQWAIRHVSPFVHSSLLLINLGWTRQDFDKTEPRYEFRNLGCQSHIIEWCSVPLVQELFLKHNSAFHPSLKHHYWFFLQPSSLQHSRLPHSVTLCSLIKTQPVTLWQSSQWVCLLLHYLLCQLWWAPLTEPLQFDIYLQYNKH